MKKQERGFTLVELLAVIVILAIILLIAVPNVMGIIEKAKEDSYDNQLEMIEKMAKTYLMSNNVSYDANNEAVLTLTELIASGVAPESIIDPRCGKEFDYDNTIITLTNNDGHVTTSIETLSECGSGSTPSVPSVPDVVEPDTSGAVVALSEGLVPIKWDGSNWVVTTTTDDSWYNYDNKQWANAISVTSSSKSLYVAGKTVEEADVLGYFVYIPRYKYQLFNTGFETVENQIINIVFESKETSKSTGSTNGTWLTHPAFTFGEEEIDGLWVGKFLIGGTIDAITVKPSGPYVFNETVGSFFYSLLELDTNHNLSLSVDSHMIKNIEFGAIAYLKQSIYGLGTTAVSMTNHVTTTSYLSNVGESTTGNLTGVYDMYGHYNYVMGVIENGSNYSELSINSVENKYIDIYEPVNEVSDFTKRKLGDATAETRMWLSDNGSFIYSTYPWFLRAGHSGMFYFDIDNGTSRPYATTRVVLIS